MLEPAFEPIQTHAIASFLVRHFNEEAFRAPYHFHPEYELTLITGGNGKRYVGNLMENFSPGDLIFLGKNLPHCWKLSNSRLSNQKDPEGKEGAVVIQFNEDFLGKEFFSKPELISIRKLFLRSQQGIQFVGSTGLQVGKEIKILLKKRDFDKMIGLLKILQQLALSNEYRFLIPSPPRDSLHEGESERIQHVLSLIRNNFKDKITLEQAADSVHMTVYAFCKYFKKVTRLTFLEMVIEYRLNYAAQQLIHTDLSVADICYDSGFGDISHFNRTFKSKMMESPLQYRKRFMKEI